jgi:hypothetical protein
LNFEKEIGHALIIAEGMQRVRHYSVLLDGMLVSIKTTKRERENKRSDIINKQKLIENRF